LRRAIQIALSLGVLAYAVYLLDWTGLEDALRRIRLSAFVQAVGLALLSTLVLAIRWHRIISPHIPLTIPKHLQNYLYATFLNSFTPANLGGDVYRLVSLKTRGASVMVVALALVRERVVGLVGYLLAYVACFAVLSSDDSRIASAGDGVFAWSAAIALLVVLAIALTPFVLRRVTNWAPIVRRPGLVTTLQNLALAVTSQSLGDLCILFGLSFVSLALWTAAIGSIAHDVGLTIPWLMLGAIAILVEIIRLVPISVQGIGVREGTFALFVGFVGDSAETGFIVAAVSYLALTAALLCSGVISWGMMLGSRNENTDSEARETD